jgi:LCP family protein required for cell wall assembly
MRGNGNRGGNGGKGPAPGKMASPNGTQPKKNGTRRRARRRIIWSAVGAVVLGIVAAGAVAFTHNPLSNENPLQSVIHIFTPINSPVNILLIGNNARNPVNPLDIGAGGGGQADIMMLAHIDPKTKHVELISIPRDMLFAMPQYNNPIPKIKTFFFIGAQMQPNQAAQLTVNAVEKFTGMHIDYWIATDFQGFSDAINAVGGVRVDVPGRIYDPAHSGANLYPGWQTLNGAQALAYIRVRQNIASAVATNDFERDNAQAQVLMALQKKLLDKRSDLSHIGGLITTWLRDVKTNMSYDDLLKMANAVAGAKVEHINLGNVGDSMQIASAPAPGMNQQNYLTGAYYDVIDPAHVYQELKQYGSTGSWTGLPLPSPSQVPVDVYASQPYVQKLQNAGYQVTVLGGSSGIYPVQIDYPPGDLAWGLAVGRTLATGNSVVQPGSNTNAVVVYGP